ncbi:helix-turn-helix domain-containing protein [Actinoplanes sp. CA-054009]
MNSLPTANELALLQLGATIRKLRDAARLSGAQLGARAHMSRSQISKIETGRISPSLEDIDRIIHALGLQQAIADEVRTQFDMLTLPESDFRKILSLGLA